MAIIIACAFLLLCASFLLLALGVCRLSGEADHTYASMFPPRGGNETPAS